MSRRLIVFAACLTVTLAPTLRAADDPVRAKLDKAKSTYEAELKKGQAAVVASFDKREDAARRAGDKKAVDLVKADRQAFQNTGAVPKGTPPAVKSQLTAARTAMEKAYKAAVQSYTRAKQDDEAAAVEKELDALLRPFEVKSMLNEMAPVVNRHMGNMYAADGTVLGRKIVVEGKEAPHGILSHPPPQGQAELAYRLDGNFEKLRCGVAVPFVEDSDKQIGIGSALTFEVLADNKVVWQSKPVKEFDAAQWCEVSVDKVKVLTLRVRCPGSAACARAVWLDPYVTARR